MLYDGCVELAVWLCVVIDGASYARFFEQSNFFHPLIEDVFPAEVKEV